MLSPITPAGRAGFHAQLDVDVYRLSTPGAGPDWVARVVDDTVGREAIEAAAAVLAALDRTPFSG
jgi:hypothetical protein